MGLPTIYFPIPVSDRLHQKLWNRRSQQTREPCLHCLRRTPSITLHQSSPLKVSISKYLNVKKVQTCALGSLCMMTKTRKRRALPTHFLCHSYKCPGLWYAKHITDEWPLTSISQQHFQGTHHQKKMYKVLKAMQAPVPF